MSSPHCPGITRQGKRCVRAGVSTHMNRCAPHWDILYINKARKTALMEYDHIVKSLKSQYLSFPIRQLDAFKRDVVMPKISRMSETRIESVDITDFILEVRKIFRDNQLPSNIAKVVDIDNAKQRQRTNFILELLKHSHSQKPVIIDARPKSAFSRTPTVISAETNTISGGMTVDTAFEMKVHEPKPPYFPETPGEMNRLRNHTDIHDPIVERKIGSIVRNLLRLEIDDAFAWKTVSLSRTPGKILSNCNLPIKIAIDLLNRYTSTESMFGTGEGTYGRVLDAVWTIICDQSSSNRDELQTELRDSLIRSHDLCLQGALGLLCNVVRNQLENIIDRNSPTHRMTDAMTGLHNIRDPKVRESRAVELMDEIKMPGEARGLWLRVIREGSI